MLADVLMGARCVIYMYCVLEGRMFFPEIGLYTCRPAVRCSARKGGTLWEVR